MSGGGIDDRMLADAALVVAHPDDEVLWFASILARVGRVIIAFRDHDAAPDLGRRRAAAMAELPYRGLIALAIPEAGSFDGANWDAPTPNEVGLELNAVADDGQEAARYRANFAALRAALRPLLAGRRHVFSHNPWGEYGHEDHVQVYRAVDSLRRELGFRQWATTYCSDHSARLAARFAAPAVPAVRRAVDGAAARRIAAIYQRHGCWTWLADWTWPAAEFLLPMPLPAADASGGQELPLTMVPSSGGGARR
ncbi:MAG: hypothetical protein JNN33_02680 [Rhodospirillaceae bacterium]|jgi:LmbE family N-acetylglucosaminyl deacetylase|nr:hypothetical protein [Rhodospirillaceae bacterium]